MGSKFRLTHRLRTLRGRPGSAPMPRATAADPTVFWSGRDFAAWIGLVPRQDSTGGKQKLGPISKQGDRYLRRILNPGFSEDWLRSEAMVVSLAHLKWGLYRLYVDALLYFGNVRSAFRCLRDLSLTEIDAFFASKRFDTDAIKRRAPPTTRPGLRAHNVVIRPLPLHISAVGIVWSAMLTSPATVVWDAYPHSSCLST
jgi:hypothetical protein